MRRPIQLIFIIFLVIVGLSVTRITVENSISTTGIELLKLQNTISSYKKENALISEKYLEDSALISLAKKANEKGFVNANNQVYLSTPLPLALNQ